MLLMKYNIFMMHAGKNNNLLYPELYINNYYK